MNLNLKDRLTAFIELGIVLDKMIKNPTYTGFSPTQKSFLQELEKTPNTNSWFTANNLDQALRGLVFMLDKKNLTNWIKNYPMAAADDITPKKVAVIMAGNIPMVGFHDFLCVLISGHSFLGKLSSQDKILPQKLADILIEIEPKFKNNIEFSDQLIKNFDAVIATGTNNSARYFDYYFGKYPHIIRKNRNSIAVLSGNESPAQIKSLANDVFLFFGLGCRNVSKIYVPKGYDPGNILDHFQDWEHLKNHSKYYNNYEYNKAIFLVNQIQHLDTGFLLARKESSFISPLSVLHYEEYADFQSLMQNLNLHTEKIQCVASSIPLENLNAPLVPLGQTQYPNIEDYADGIDTMKFLLGLPRP